jgi:hypothetical protein
MFSKEGHAIHVNRSDASYIYASYVARAWRGYTTGSVNLLERFQLILHFSAYTDSKEEI